MNMVDWKYTSSFAGSMEMAQLPATKFLEPGGSSIAYCGRAEQFDDGISFIMHYPTPAAVSLRFQAIRMGAQSSPVRAVQMRRVVRPTSTQSDTCTLRLARLQWASYGAYRDDYSRRIVQCDRNVGLGFGDLVFMQCAFPSQSRWKDLVGIDYQVGNTRTRRLSVDRDAISAFYGRA